MSNANAMTSRERVLNAYARRETDHVPLYLRYHDMRTGAENVPFDWHDPVTRIENHLKRGLDDMFRLQPPLGFIEQYHAERAPDVRISAEIAYPDDAPHGVLTKTYETPAGILEHVVKRTEDWADGDDVMLFSDYNVPRAQQHAVTRKDDLPMLRCLLAEPSEAQLDAFRRHAAQVRADAQRLGVAVEGGWIALGDAAVMLCGMERVLETQMLRPAFLEELLDILLEWETRRVGHLLDAGVDAIVHMAWYEGTDFFTPKNYRALLKPRLKRLVDQTHAKGAAFRYIITKGLEPLLDDFLDLGIDCITGIDPVQDTIDLRRLKARVGDRICLMGGVNSAVMLTQWDDDAIRRAVGEAFDALAPGGGFILHPVDAVFNNQPWEKVETLIAAWRECCNEGGSHA